MSKRKTNVQAVRDMMEFSQYGALAQCFIIEAIQRYAERCSAAPAELFDSPMMNGKAWKGVALEIKEKIAAHLGD